MDEFDKGGDFVERDGGAAEGAMAMSTVLGGDGLEAIHIIACVLGDAGHATVGATRLFLRVIRLALVEGKAMGGGLFSLLGFPEQSLERLDPVHGPARHQHEESRQKVVKGQPMVTKKT